MARGQWLAQGYPVSTGVFGWQSVGRNRAALRHMFVVHEPAVDTFRRDGAMLGDCAIHNLIVYTFPKQSRLGT